MTLRPD